MSEHIEGYKPTVEELQGRAKESISTYTPKREALNAPRPISEPVTNNGVSLEAVRQQLQELKNRRGGRPEGRPVVAYNPTPDGLGPLEWFDKIAARAQRNAQEASQMKKFSWWGLFLAILGGILSAPAIAAFETLNETQTQEG